MKVLTIWQPWATLIIQGAKPYEFRGWRPPQAVIGQRIVIHSAARLVKAAEVDALCLALSAGGDRAAETCLRRDAALELLIDTPLAEYPLGAAIGTAVVGEPRIGPDIAAEFGLSRVNDSDRDAHANWGWPMLHITPWFRPMEMRGYQGLWNFPTPESAGL